MPYLVLRNMTLIDGAGGAPRPKTTIVIKDKQIEAIGPDGSVAYPPDAAVYDGGGRYALPGLIDCHVHTAFTAAADLSQQTLKELPSYFAIRSTVHARNLLHAGVTAVRDGGSNAYNDIALRNAINNGLVEGPRIDACGFGIKMTSGHGDSFYSPTVTIDSPGLANTPDETRKVARMDLKMGANHIKILSCSGGVMSEGTEPGVAQYTVEEMKAAIDEAHKVGKKAMAHAHGTQAIKNAIEAGIDSVEHGSYLDDEGCEMMIKRGIFLVPTLLATYRIVQHGDGGGIPAWAVRKARQVREDHVINFGRAVKAGVKIAMGTDAGTPYNVHGENLTELALMVEAGMAPMQAIVSATKMGAELIGWSDKIGTLAAGKLADVVVVDGDPLKDISLFKEKKNVVCVIKDGAVVRSSLALGS